MTSLELAHDVDRPHDPAYPRISVVTVCLNDLAGLQSTFESVRCQTAPPHQWIVADGSSSDGTQGWLASLDYDRLTWRSARDGGIYQGMNAGLGQADGDYVLFLNSGDALSGPNVLGAVREFLATSTRSPALLYGDCYEVNSAGEAFLRRARPAWWVWLGMPTSHQAMYFRLDGFRDGFDTRYRWSGDYDAVARLYTVNGGEDFARLSVPLCRFHLGGRSDLHRRAFLQETLDIRRTALGMGPVPARMLHAAHHVQGWIKKSAPSVHRLMRYG